MWLLCPPGVYRPQVDTWLLADALHRARIRPGAAVLEIGCGSGALSILVTRTKPRSVTAVDVSRRAVWTTRVNTLMRGLDVKVERGDAIERMAGRTFDLIVANPPYVPGPHEVPMRGKTRAWDAGVDGRALLDRLCVNAPVLLAPGGTLLMVHSALCDVDTTLHQLRGGGMKATVVGRAQVPFGPVLRSRTDVLRERGLIEPGQRAEELVVVRADQPSNPAQ